jgi:hypothetical protein
LLVSQPKEPRSIPTTAGDGERDLREAGIGLAAPGEAIGKYGDLVHPTIPFATENGAGPNLGTPTGRTQGAPRSFFRRFGMIEQTPTLVIKIAVPGRPAADTPPCGTEDGAEGDGVGASRTRYANGYEALRRRDRANVRSRRQAFHGPAAQDRSLPLAQGIRPAAAVPHEHWAYRHRWS